jgi:tellurite resistance protein
MDIYLLGTVLILGLLGAVYLMERRTPAAKALYKPPTKAGPLETRLREETVSGKHTFVVQRIEARGRFPLERKTRLGFLVSVADVTDSRGDKSLPSLALGSRLEEYQEAESTCFQGRLEIGEVDPGKAWLAWTSVLPVIPETLVPPYGGSRSLRVSVLLCDLDAPPTVSIGEVVAGKAITEWQHEFSWTFSSEGYREHTERLQEIEHETVAIAIVMAFSDGKFQAVEGDVIKKWIERRLGLLSETRRQSRKKQFNDLIQAVHSQCRTRSFPLGEAVSRLRAIADPGACLEAVELSLDVMSADGRATDRELAAVDGLAGSLGVDGEIYTNFKHRRLMEVEHSQGTGTDYYALLSIDRSWSPAQVQTHLNTLYDKWNARAESLVDADMRAKAEQMMTHIAEARAKLLA